MKRTSRRVYRAKRSIAATRRNAYRRRRVRYSKKSRIPLEVPTRQMVKLRFAETRNFGTTVAAAGAELKYSMNSVYDPYYPTGGGSCSGFSYWANMFESYVVKGCKFECTLWKAQGVKTTYAGVIATRPDLSPIAPANYKDWIMESKGAGNYAVMLPLQANVRYPAARFKRYYSVAKYVAPNKVTDPKFCGTSSSDPDGQPLIHLVVAQDDLEDTTFQAVVRITYYVEFFDPQTYHLVE